MTLDEYKKAKLSMIQEEFYIILSDYDYWNIMEAKDEMAVDRAAREIFNKYL